MQKDTEEVSLGCEAFSRTPMETKRECCRLLNSGSVHGSQWMASEGTSAAWEPMILCHLDM